MKTKNRSENTDRNEKEYLIPLKKTTTKTKIKSKTKLLLLKDARASRRTPTWDSLRHPGEVSSCQSFCSSTGICSVMDNWRTLGGTVGKCLRSHSLITAVSGEVVNVVAAKLESMDSLNAGVHGHVGFAPAKNDLEICRTKTRDCGNSLA